MMSQPEKKARPRERGQKYALTYSGDDDDDDDEKGIDREELRRIQEGVFKKKAREVYMSVCVEEKKRRKEGSWRVDGAKVYGVHIRTSTHDVKRPRPISYGFAEGLLDTIRKHADADSGKNYRPLVLYQYY